jgi:hypothetical protein
MVTLLQNKPTCKVAMVLKTCPLNEISDLTVHTHLKSILSNINSQELSKYDESLVRKLLMGVVYYLRNIK